MFQPEVVPSKNPSEQDKVEQKTTRTEAIREEVYKWTVRETAKWLESPHISLLYRRDKALNSAPSKSTHVYKKRTPKLAGLDVYICKCMGRKRHVASKPFKFNTPLSGNCKARFTINFPAGYSHDSTKNINVDVHGDMIVTLTWKRWHQHELSFNFFKSLPLSTELRELLHVATATELRRPPIDTPKHQPLLRNPSDWVFMEILGTRRHRLDYRTRKSTFAEAIKGHTVLSSLESWAEAIRSDGGVAELTDQFPTLDGTNSYKNYVTNGNRRVWLFLIMTSWQQDTLGANQNVFYLGAIQDVCHWTEPGEKAGLLPLVVKNQVTGRPSPVAFMITNAVIAPVITHFLNRVKAITNFKPCQAVIGCDPGEVFGLHKIYGDTLLVAYSRYDIMEAFKLNVRKLITENVCDEGQIKTTQEEAIRDFNSIFDSPTAAEGERKMEAYYKKFAPFNAFLAYAQCQWLTIKQHIIAGWSPRYVQEQNLNDFIQTFHQVFLERNLNGETALRPDVLVQKLIAHVEPGYAVEEGLISCGFGERHQDDGERMAEQKAEEVANEEIDKMVTVVGKSKFVVKSFTVETQVYSVDLNSIRLLTAAGPPKQAFNPTCTCLVYSKSRSRCKHIYLARKSQKLSRHSEIKWRSSDLQNRNGIRAVNVVELPPITRQNNAVADVVSLKVFPPPDIEVNEIPRFQRPSNSPKPDSSLFLSVSDARSTRLQALSEPITAHATSLQQYFNHRPISPEFYGSELKRNTVREELPVGGPSLTPPGSLVLPSAGYLQPNGTSFGFPDNNLMPVTEISRKQYAEVVEAKVNFAEFWFRKSYEAFKQIDSLEDKEKMADRFTPVLKHLYHSMTDSPTKSVH